MLSIEVSDQLDVKGKVVDKIATITKQIPQITKFSKTEIENKKASLQIELDELTNKMEELDLILSKFI